MLLRKTAVLCCCGLLLLLRSVGGIIHAQSSPTPTSEEHSHGIELYKKGDTKAAIATLTAAVKKNSSDGMAWYYLGLARVREDNLKEARKVFETAANLLPDFAPAHSSLAYTLILLGKSSDAEREADVAVKLNYQDANAHYVLGAARLLRREAGAALEEAESAIKYEPALAVAYLLKAQSLLTTYSDEVAGAGKTIRAPREGPPTERERQEASERNQHQTALMRSAVEALSTYLTLAPPGPETESWRYQLKTMRVYSGVNQPKEGDSPTPSASAGTGTFTRVVIMSKPEPIYTLAARRAGVHGTVILRAVFSARGTVDDILVLRSLPYGLTEETIVAAKRIKFKPATNGGQPVSMFLQLEYHFNVN
jgi:TonB family protein